MNKIEVLLSELRKLDINLWLDGENLRCNAPKGTLTPEVRSRLADHKGEIIQFLQQSYQKAKLTSEMIETIPRNQPIPVSFSQQRLWFLAQLEQDNSPYNEFYTLEIEGNLQIEILRKSLQEIVQRHEVLRTNFQEINGSIFQIISSQLKGNILSVIDLQKTPPAEQSEQVKNLVGQIIENPFDLANESLFRATLIQLEINSFVLVLCLHHIICDGWSMGIFMAELSQLYQAFSQGLDSPLADLSIQYADFAHWQRRWLTGDVLENQLTYWKEQLAGLPPLLDLSTDRPRPAIQTFRGNTESLSLSRELTEKLQQFSHQSGKTLFMTLLAALSVLLYRYSGQEDIAIGTPIANRNRREIESLIGFFVNTLILRLNLAENPRFDQLLAQVQQITLEAYSHQDIPFEKLVEELKPERSLSHTPLFQVMFAWQNTPAIELELGELILTPLETESVIAKFDLSLSMAEIKGELVGEWEYNSDIFQRETIQAMNIHFQTLLKAIVENSQENISQLPILTPAEQEQILITWNDTQTEYPKDQCIHQLFEQQVEKTPDAIAVEFKEQRLTYGQLNRKANQLAHYLQQLGVKAEVLVGLSVERSLEMLIGMLGILKAGGAYVPIDPAYPQERIRYILEDSQVSLILTQDSLLSQMTAQGKIAMGLDTTLEKLASYSKENLTPVSSPSNLAYIIYTSGSTGHPKGVEITHQSLGNFITVAQKIYQIAPQDRILQFASISFDTAVEEIYPCLCAGATLVLRREKMLGSNAQFWQECAQEKISVLDLPTAYWHQLTTDQETLIQNFPDSVRLVIIGGEEALAENLKLWQEGMKTLTAQGTLSKPIRLLNTYGPTEATVISTVSDLTNLESPELSIPIGRPIGNTQVYILDRYQQPVPVGVPGELYISGVGLARGYFNRRELTQEKFIENLPELQWLKLRGLSQRLYKTGDLVKYRKGGQIEYLGRIDNQVKIRGFRIELGEIESVLTQHPEVREALVIVSQSSTVLPQLVAYLVSNFIPERIPYHESCSLEFEGKIFSLEIQDISERGINLKGMITPLTIGSLVHLFLKLPGELQEIWLDGHVVWNQEDCLGVEFKLDSLQKERLNQNFQHFLLKQGWWQLSQRSLTEHLRHYLSQKLPDYMIPHTFVLMNAFPLTPNGKIDRRSLPSPSSFKVSWDEDFKVPQTATEKMLASIWSDVLRLKEISIEDNFFALGGHSLLVTQVLSRLRTELNLEIPVRKLFEAPTLKQFAQIIDTIQGQEPGLSAPAIQRVSRDARRMKRSSLNNNP